MDDWFDENWPLVLHARRKDLNCEEQLKLARHDDFGIAEVLAANTALCLETFRELERNTNLWSTLAQNPALPGEILERMIIASSPEVSPAALMNHPNATPHARDFALSQIQLEDGEPIDEDDGYDPLNWISGQSHTFENALWRKHPWYGDLYHQAEPTSAQLEDEWLLERWTASLSFTPDYVLQRITEKLAPRLVNHEQVSSDYMDVPQVARDLATMSDQPQIRQILSAIAKHRNTNATTLRTIQEVNDPLLHVIIAENPNTSQPILKRILQHKDAQVRAAVARHPSPKVHKLLNQLLEALDEDGLCDLAKNRNLTPTDLSKVLEVASTPVRAAAATNPNLPLGREQKFAVHPHWSVRAGIASNPAASQDTLARLAEDPEPAVIEQVARNPGTSRSVLMDLYNTNQNVRPALASNPALPVELVTLLTSNTATDTTLAANPATPPAVLEIIAQRGSPDALKALAAEGRSRELLNVLASTPDLKVQWNCVNHDTTATDTLEYLQTHGIHWSIRHAARRRLLNDNGDLETESPLDTFRRTVTENL